MGSEGDKLALFGGPKTIQHRFPAYNSIGDEEKRAAAEVIESGVLSKFIGAWGEDFFGGSKVREFEQKCEDYFGVKHAITVNSWTSGLIAAVGAIGIEPGEEVIVSPFTMCASATAILHWNAIPVFADIDPDTFCIDPKSIEANISDQTRAIMVVDILGHPVDMKTIMEIASRHDLKVITDSAQAPGAKYRGKFAGTLSHIGGFSLNYHKHIHTGEGGILVTDDNALADRLRLIRNHGEAVVEAMGIEDLSNMVGHNFRLGEIECAMGISQLDKLGGFVNRRQELGQRMTRGLSDLDGLTPPVVRPHCTHAYYGFGMKLDVHQLGVSRERIVEALSAEGVTGLGNGYVNVHRLPMYQQKIAYGSAGFPWNSEFCKRQVDYSIGICPVAEELHDKTFLSYAMCMHELNNEDVDLIVEAFKKVWSQLDVLR